MRESHVEGLAIHNGPESCAGGGDTVGEALTGVRAGQVLSRETRTLRGADPVEEWGRLHQVSRYREVSLGSARSETLCTYGNTSHGNREVPSSPMVNGPMGRVGKSKDVRR